MFPLRSKSKIELVYCSAQPTPGQVAVVVFIEGDIAQHPMATLTRPFLAAAAIRPTLWRTYAEGSTNVIRTQATISDTFMFTLTLTSVSTSPP